jgi:glycosyltransferase involved in cell wall biosynthesis
VKVLFVNHLPLSHSTGGAERSIQLLLDGLKSAGVDSYQFTANQDYIKRRKIIISSRRGSSTFIQCLSFCRRIALHSSRIHSPTSYRSFVLKLDTYKPDIVHTHNIGGIGVSIWRACKQRNIPLVHTLRDFNLLSLSNSRCGGDRSSLDRFVSTPKRILSNNVDAVVGISHYILKRHTESGFFRFSNFQTVIPNGVVPPKDISCESITSPPYSVGFLGTLSRDKGVEVFLKAIEHTDPNIVSRALLGGTGHPDYIDSLMKTYVGNRIRFLGFVDPSQFFKHIALLVVPSLWPEPFGRVIIEANSYGVPVLATSRGGIPELVYEGQNGWLYHSCSDHIELASKIQTSLASLRDAGFKERCTCAASRFDYRSTSKSYVELYSQTLNRH